MKEDSVGLKVSFSEEEGQRGSEGKRGSGDEGEDARGFGKHGAPPSWETASRGVIKADRRCFFYPCQASVL